ncbi:MAG: hypothetical protein KGI10_02715 [Thaumarchaeota archaeon]|nr:hypothetical protein [Nitrososphaerota archaeon]
MTRKCATCGKVLEEPQATHCSDACLHKSIEKSKPFDPKMAKRKTI